MFRSIQEYICMHKSLIPTSGNNMLVHLTKGRSLWYIMYTTLFDKLRNIITYIYDTKVNISLIRQNKLDINIIRTTY